MKQTLLFGGANTYYMNWKEDKDYEGHVKRLKNINDKSVDVASKYQNLDKLIDFSHKKREFIKDFNRKEYSFNLGQDNNRLKKKLEEISLNKSKDTKHAHEHSDFSSTLYNNNKIITQRYKSELNKQLEQENIMLATRIMNLRSQYQKEEQTSHFQFHQLYKKNMQKFRKRDRSLVLSVQSNHLDEYSPNNSVFEVFRPTATATNSQHTSQNQSPLRLDSANNSAIVFLPQQQQSPNSNAFERRFQPQLTKRPQNINKTTPMKNISDKCSIELVSEHSKDVICAERSVDSISQGERRNPMRVRSNLTAISSPANRQKEMNDTTRRNILGGRDIFLVVMMKRISFKTFIPSETDDDLYYFIISAGENKASRTQLKAFKKIQSSNYHLAFESNKLQKDEQKVQFQLWQNKRNTDIFQGEFFINMSQELENKDCDFEMRKTVPRTFVSGRVFAQVNVNRLDKQLPNENSTYNNQSDKALSIESRVNNSQIDQEQQIYKLKDTNNAKEQQNNNFKDKLNNSDKDQQNNFKDKQNNQSNEQTETAVVESRVKQFQIDRLKDYSNSKDKQNKVNKNIYSNQITNSTQKQQVNSSLK